MRCITNFVGSIVILCSTILLQNLTGSAVLAPQGAISKAESMVSPVIAFSGVSASEQDVAAQTGVVAQQSPRSVRTSKRRAFDPGCHGKRPSEFEPCRRRARRGVHGRWGQGNRPSESCDGLPLESRPPGRPGERGAERKTARRGGTGAAQTSPWELRKTSCQTVGERIMQYQPPYMSTSARSESCHASNRRCGGEEQATREGRRQSGRRFAWLAHAQ